MKSLKLGNSQITELFKKKMQKHLKKMKPFFTAVIYYVLPLEFHLIWILNPQHNTLTCCWDWSRASKYVIICLLKFLALSFCKDEPQMLQVRQSERPGQRLSATVGWRGGQTSKRKTSFLTVAETRSKSRSYCVTLASHCERETGQF